MSATADHESAALVASAVAGDEYAFARIVALPSAGVENHRYVLVLPLPATPPPRPETKGEETAKSRRDRAPRGRKAER